jgi:general secretion pathway protein J
MLGNKRLAYGWRTFRAPTQGFTLLELLVALILLSLIFLFLMSALQFGTNVWSGREKEVSGTAEVLTAQNFLRRVLSEARPIMIEATRTKHRYVYFIGDQNSVQFIAPLPEHLGVGGFYEIALYLTDNRGSGKRLEMSWRLSSEAENSKARRVTLLDGVAQIQFSYFGRPLLLEPSRWHDDWQKWESLPDLIRIQVTFSDGEQLWPQLTVATHVNRLSVVIGDDGA